jgi:hypothetical protein
MADVVTEATGLVATPVTAVVRCKVLATIVWIPFAVIMLVRATGCLQCYVCSCQFSTFNPFSNPNPMTSYSTPLSVSMGGQRKPMITASGIYSSALAPYNSLQQQPLG